MRFAVIGAGVIGRLHAQTIQSFKPRAEVAVVVDTVAERAQSVAREVGAEATTSLAEALARSDVDAVTIGTPSGLHADAAVAAIEAGKHVIIEKPIDIRLDAARRILEAEKRSDRTVMVVSQHRHDPASLIIHDAVKNGKFGKLTSGNAIISWWRSQSYYDSGDWRGTWALDGGGALMNQGIHTIDLFTWFLGEPLEVYAWTGCLAHERIEVEDTAVATVRFANGALGVIHGTTAAYPGIATRVQVHGDRGSAIIDRNKLVYYHAAKDSGEDYPYGAGPEANQAAEVLAEYGYSEPSEEAKPTVAGLTATSHTTQFQDFLDAVEQGRPPLVTAEEATRTLAVIRGIYESARLQRPVSIKELTS
ncbi:Gfo/Idh/MocA family protein [Thermasporomyces composti]|jgi:predicted dehydrogenase|uniref:Putative dehydrogenase n=1 Tax=Thermasporomyces composti TaxID=696763 RepID=A0A3D9V9K6_THECX|nr:Gfo/Idh/MocA family oxidoreductase [Thermasporomyces composti]REF37976.1 putative dehydrogenase [Thermasporomyces composti]